MNPISHVEIQEFYDSLAEDYHRYRTESIALFNEYIDMPATVKLAGDIQNGTTILDIGCGSGLYSKYFAELGGTVTGVDLSSIMIQLAKKHCVNLNVSFINSPFEDANLDGMSFDLIIASFMLSYFSDLEFVFNKMNQCLKDTGKIVTSMLHPVRMSKYLKEPYFSDLAPKYNAEIIPGKEKININKWTEEDVVEAAFRSGLFLEQLLLPKPVEIDFTKNPELEFYLKYPSMISFSFKRRLS